MAKSEIEKIQKSIEQETEKLRRAKISYGHLRDEIQRLLEEIDNLNSRLAREKYHETSS